MLNSPGVGGVNTFLCGGVSTIADVPGVVNSREIILLTERPASAAVTVTGFVVTVGLDTVVAVVLVMMVFLVTEVGFLFTLPLLWLPLCCVAGLTLTSEDE